MKGSINHSKSGKLNRGSEYFDNSDDHDDDEEVGRSGGGIGGRGEFLDDTTYEYDDEVLLHEGSASNESWLNKLQNRRNTVSLSLSLSLSFFLRFFCFSVCVCVCVCMYVCSSYLFY